MYKTTGGQTIAIDVKSPTIIEIAESWIGTPFIYGACQKGRGVDCAKFIYSVFKEYGAIDTDDLPPHLPANWNCGKIGKENPDIFKKQLLRYGKIVPFVDRQPGDVISFLYHGVESHVGVLTEDECIIHAVSGKRVMKQRLRSYNNVCAVYRLKDV